MDIKNSSFKSYLKMFQKKLGMNHSGAFSLYKYSKEFQNFLKNEIKVDTSLAKLSISDILEQSFYDNLNNKDADIQSTGDEKKDLLAAFLKNMFNNSDLKDILDKDKSGTIDKEEFNTFLKAMDDNGDLDLTLEELFSGLEKIKDGSLSNIFSPAPTEETPPTSGGGGGGGGDYDAGGNKDTNDKETPKTLENMSLEELNTEKTTRETALNKAQEDLQAVFNGSNEKVKSAQEKLDTAKTAYDEAVKNDTKIEDSLKTEREDNLKAIDEKNTTVNTTKSDISKKEREISSQQAVITSDDATISALKEALRALGSSDDPEQKKEIAEKKQSIEAQIKTAEDKKKEDEAKLTKLQEELNNLNTALTTAQDEIKGLETTRQNIESRISANCGEETKNALAAYNAAKTELDSVKAAEETTAKNAVEEAQKAVTEVNNQIDVKNSEKIKSENSIKPNAFAENVQYTYQNLNDGQNDYSVILPKDYDPNKKYPTLVYMHGSGEVGTNAQNLLNSSLPKTLLNGGLNNMQENFNGIIILPHLKGGNWCNDKAEAQVRKTLADAQSKFNVDKENICVGGHSLGGMGTIYMAKHMDDVFKKAAVFSGYNVGSVDLSSIKIPVIGIVGGSGDGSSYDYMYGTKNHPSKFRQAIGNNVYVVGSAHGSVPGVGLQQLKTEDGKRPLIFDWLFG